ncbi:MAG: serine hydroxymethyltransferase, partial [Lachnospiraceae bacterium]|nr:serine hydroxymethyltransferase [Lachnospiraceae bacterium]
NIELIASENFVSNDVLKACGSILTNKYSEGYPANHKSGNKGRYYGGCQIVDKIEERCSELWKKVFNTDYHVNVQPHSGSTANFAAYFSVLNAGDTILSMSLNNGAHLTHGSPVSFSGRLFNMVFYEVDERGFIDMDDVYKKAKEHHPKLILAGASAYSRIIPFDKFAKIAKEVNAYFMVDMAHIAGLIAAGEHPTPFGYADIITTTTHKTLRGPRGGMIFCKNELASKIDSAIFPFSQGGPLQHIIAAKAVAAEECLLPSYKEYIHQVVINSKAMSEEFKKMGYNIITGGTDNHLFLLDLTHKGITGKECQELLDEHHITVNKNCIPQETRSPKVASGIRIGTAAMTTKGYKEKDFIEVAHRIDALIDEFMKNK